jgi:hypothetical protein
MLLRAASSVTLLFPCLPISYRDTQCTKEPNSKAPLFPCLLILRQKERSRGTLCSRQHDLDFDGFLKMSRKIEQI